MEVIVKVGIKYYPNDASCEVFMHSFPDSKHYIFNRWFERDMFGAYPTLIALRIWLQKQGAQFRQETIKMVEKDEVYFYVFTSMVSNFPEVALIKECLPEQFHQ